MPSNPISAFLVRNLVVVFFFYGLAFFSLGLALLLAGQRTSRFKFVRAIRPLAAFGILHGIHEWLEMFQHLDAPAGIRAADSWQEGVRLALLAVSFLMLAAFAFTLIRPDTGKARRGPCWQLLVMAGVWLISSFTTWWWLQSEQAGFVALADVLARYTLGIPAAWLGSWALMTQQRTFREHGMPEFGRDLVWCAAALFLYGAFGQLFVRPTPLPPSNIINSQLFLDWFGIPIQLFRGLMAAVLTVYMVRALNAFEVEGQRRLAEAHAATLRAQAEALEAERRTTREMERLNEELRLRAHELALLVDLSNLLAAAPNLYEGLRTVLERNVASLTFPAAGMIVLARREPRLDQVAATVGYPSEGSSALLAEGRVLAQRSIERGLVVCRHLDGTSYEFMIQNDPVQDRCREHPSPIVTISFPLVARRNVIGSMVFSWAGLDDGRPLSSNEYQIMLGISQQLALSIENARLHQQAQERERQLGELLRQVVTAQEAERQRIARELHDATGQSLTAVALGLRGVENSLTGNPEAAREQVKELRSYTTQALTELRRIIANLRPSQLDDLGLVAALQWYTAEFEQRYRLPVRFVCEGERARLPAEYETVLFRITQEALNNVAKHAQASQAIVRLEVTAGRITLSITDNGRGFDVDRALRHDQPRNGWGLLGIMERAWLLGGQCEIRSAPGQGTTVQVSVTVQG